MCQIRTKRLLLRPLGFEDFSQLAGIDAHTREAMEGLYRLGEGMWYSYWKISLLSGEHAGGFCFMGKPVNGSVEIGYGILPAYHNRGFMSEAIDGICRFAKEAGVCCITAETEIENAASQRVLMKNGFCIGERRAESILFRKELGD